MKKIIAIVTGSLCIFTSTLVADEALPLASIENSDTPAVLDDAQDQAPKQVGKASADSANTAKSSNIAKYALAAGAVAIGIAALILVSRHHGHHHHKHK